jgi:nitrite reductase (NADH) large subunit
MRRLVVIGNGMAGARVVEEILDRGGGDRFAITVFGAEPCGGYSRIALPNVLAGTQDAEDVVLNPLDWYEANGVTLHAGKAIVGIDPRAKTVSDTLGTTHRYDQLIVATGSRPAFPPVEGLHSPDGALKPGAFGFRTLDDCEAMVSWARHVRRVVVVGGGLLGLEAGRGLLERGLDVDIVHRAPRLMNLQLDVEGAAMLRETVEELGMRVRLNASATRLLGERRVEGVELADGTRLECDMVVFATGIRPNSELAAQAGLRVERAILVDDTLRAVGCEDIYAIGECTEHRGAVPGLWAPAWEQAAVVADRLTGADPAAVYHGSKLATKLKVSGVQLATMGRFEPEDERDEVVRYSEPRRRIYKTVIIRDGQVAGAILLGDLARAPFLTQAFDNATVLPEDRAALLFDMDARQTSDGVDELPMHAEVCICNGVSKADIHACVIDGKHTLREVSAATRAGTGCGSCRQRVVEVVQWAAREAA